MRLLFVAGEGAGEGISVGVGALRAARVARAVQAGRLEYEAAVTALSGKATSMASQGMTAEQIARALTPNDGLSGYSLRTLRLQISSRKSTRNLAEYGDKLGPTVDWFRAKGRTWEQITRIRLPLGRQGPRFLTREAFMVWLQSQDQFDALAVIDPETGKLAKFSQCALGDSAPARTEGWFADLSGVVAAIYKKGDELFVRVGGTELPLAADVTAEVSGAASARVLVISKGGNAVVRCRYALDTSIRFPNDPTPQIEDEDFDFGLFICNVSKATERQMVLLGRS